MIVESLGRRRVHLGLTATAFVIVLVILALAAQSSQGAPDVAMVDVTRGEFVDVVELRGEVRAVASRVLARAIG